jgi:hypothetical protein
VLAASGSAGSGRGNPLDRWRWSCVRASSLFTRAHSSTTIAFLATYWREEDAARFD